jgi:hypothetical protein
MIRKSCNYKWDFAYAVSSFWLRVITLPSELVLKWQSVLLEGWMAFWGLTPRVARSCSLKAFCEPVKNRGVRVVSRSLNCTLSFALELKKITWKLRVAESAAHSSCWLGHPVNGVRRLTCWLPWPLTSATDEFGQLFAELTGFPVPAIIES